MCNFKGGIVGVFHLNDEPGDFRDMELSLIRHYIYDRANFRGFISLNEISELFDESSISIYGDNVGYSGKDKPIDFFIKELEHGDVILTWEERL